MKKYLLMSLVAMGALVSSADSYLYWMANAPAERTWDYARLMYTPEGTTPANPLDGAAFDAGGNSIASWANITGLDSSSYSFYVEYMSGDGVGTDDTVLFSSAILSYESIKSSIKESITEMGVSAVSFNVPEPTSGMMLLLGMGLLALKRKKA